MYYSKMAWKVAIRNAAAAMITANRDKRFEIHASDKSESSGGHSQKIFTNEAILVVI